MRHEILNEEANEKVYLDILGFLNTASFWKVVNNFAEK
jgi:hypothetical protein